MAVYHLVEQGEHLSGIAMKYGFADYRTIWEHVQNKGLREKRKNPNVLFPGDRLYIPDKQVKKETRPTGQRHRFEVPTHTLMLRIVVEKLNGEPMANTKCELQVEGKVYQLTTDGKGLVKQQIPKTAENGRLTIKDTEDSVDIEVPIKIGHLDPVDEISGWEARLNNLGYRAGTSTDANDPQLRSAVEEFQCDHGLTVDGVCGPQTQAKLKQAHGC